MAGIWYAEDDMPKYFLPPGQLYKNEIVLADDLAHHLITVLRVKMGDPIILCDGNCHDFRCTVTEIRKNRIIVTKNEKYSCLTEPPIRVTLYQSLIKLDKFEWVIQKCIELGIYAIIPMVTNHTVPKMNESSQKLERFRKIAKSASEQSMRGIIPAIHAPLSLSDATKNPKESLRLLACENEHNNTIRSVLRDCSPCDVSIWIGPEGGFSKNEIESLCNHGAIRVSLGPRILRTETAGMTALVQILNTWEV